MTPSRARRGPVVVLVALCTLLCSSCGLFDPANLPTSERFARGWRMSVDFPTLVSLPNQSRVTVDGVRSGVVRQAALHDGSVRVNLVMDDGARVSRAASVELRQDTLLGDTYVAITNPAGSRDWVAEGAIIGRKQVRSPIQIEALLVNLSDFIGSGSMVRLGQSIQQINAQFPKDPDQTRAMTASLSETLVSWAKNTESLTAILTDVDGITTGLKENADIIGGSLTDEGLHHWSTVFNAVTVFELLGKFAYILKPLVFLVPELKGTVGLVNEIIKPLMFPGWPTPLSREGNLDALARLITEKVIPFTQNPRWNVRLVTSVPAREQADQIVKTLRMIGMAP